MGEEEKGEMTAHAYYNENNAYCAQWLRNLIAAGHIAAGDVDERSIEDVSPDDLAGYSQCHFFAGIGGWSYALRLAGVPDDMPVWSGSCPCQPFSVAGKQRGAADERHLWPVWYRLIRERRPRLIFGEQVASLPALAWWDDVCADLEGAGYACAAANLCAAGVGAPHIRQRLYWLADHHRNGRNALPIDALHDTQYHSQSCGDSGLLADSGEHRPQGRVQGRKDKKWEVEHGQVGCLRTIDWRDCRWLNCKDGKLRPIESSIEPLADGISCRVGRLRAYGNAIVPQVAAAFVRAAYASAPHS